MTAPMPETVSPRLTIVDVTVAIQKGDRLEHAQLAAAFDVITTQDAARMAGRQLGSGLGEALALQLQQGQSLAAGRLAPPAAAG